MSSTDYIDHAGFAPSEGTEQMKDVRNSPATAALESSHPDLGQKHPLVPINDKPNIIKKDSPTSMKVPQKIILPSPSQSRKRPRSETPSEIMQSLEQRLKKFKTLSSSDADQWIFSTEELLFTPSFVHLGKKYYDEVFERARGCDFMRKCARDLGLPTETLCMAKMLFHRFYMRKPMTQTKDYIYWHIAATSLFIAVKSNDTYRKLDAIIPVVIKYSSKKENVTPRDKEWIVWKDIILSTEDVILMSVCFDLTMEFPHAYAVDLVWQYSEIVPASVLDKLAIQAYHYSTDCLNSMLCLKLPPHLLAYVAVFMACQSVGTQLVDPINNQPFWTVANFRERFLKDSEKHVTALSKISAVSSLLRKSLEHRLCEPFDDPTAINQPYQRRIFVQSTEKAATHSVQPIFQHRASLLNTPSPTSPAKSPGKQHSPARTSEDMSSATPISQASPQSVVTTTSSRESSKPQPASNEGTILEPGPGDSISRPPQSESNGDARKARNTDRNVAQESQKAVPWKRSGHANSNHRDRPKSNGPSHSAGQISAFGSVHPSGDAPRHTNHQNNPICAPMIGRMQRPTFVPAPNVQFQASHSYANMMPLLPHHDMHGMGFYPHSSHMPPQHMPYSAHPPPPPPGPPPPMPPPPPLTDDEADINVYWHQQGEAQFFDGTIPTQNHQQVLPGSIGMWSGGPGWKV